MANESEFEFEKMKAAEAEQLRRSLWGGRGGGRRSKYSPVGEQMTGLGADEVLTFEVAPNQIISLRNYVQRNFGDDYKVASRRVSDEAFKVFISRRSADDPPKKRAPRKPKG